jgi:hypothetical protein
LQRWCVQSWPDHFTNKTQYPDVASFNKKHGGWDIELDRVFFSNGQGLHPILSHLAALSSIIGDGWRYATLSSDLNFRRGSDRMPIFMSDGYHMDDFLMPTTSPSVKQVQDLAIAYIGQWVQEWRAQRPNVDPSSNFTTPDPKSLPRPKEYTPPSIPEAIKSSGPAPLPPYLQA